MKVPIQHFPGVGVVGHICDACRKPLGFVVYRGKDGEYCSNVCFESIERKGENMKKKSKKTTAPVPTELEANSEVADAPETPKKASKPDTKKAAVKASKNGKAPAASKKAAAVKGKPASSNGEVVGIPGVKVYRAGTANAAVYSLLADGKTHSLEECYKAATKAGAKYERDALWFVLTDGNKTKAWTVNKDKEKGTVRMVKK